MLQLSTETIYKLKGKPESELRRVVDEHYNNYLRYDSVVNNELGIRIHFNSIGMKKTAWGGKMTMPVAVAALNLKELLKEAKYNNWGEAKPAHRSKYKAIGFLNFKATCVIDGVRRSFRIPVMVTADGKFHYFINQNEKK